MGVICGLTVSCVKNNEIDIRKAIIERSVNTCLKTLKVNNPEENHDYCECAVNGFVNEMSLDELEKYGQDDPRIEQKANILLDKYSTECKTKLK